VRAPAGSRTTITCLRRRLPGVKRVLDAAERSRQSRMVPLEH
jgi:hypothetical protein